MKLILSLLVLLTAFTAVAEEKEGREVSREELDEKFSAAEERHKDNPHMLRLIRQLKEGVDAKYGKQEIPPEQPAQPAFDASKDTASNAYKNADYDTAFKHYKALAEQGDSEAAMMLGVMYQGGLGTEKDNAAAHAWYKKSSEQGMSGSGALLEVIEEDDMTPGELQEAEKYYGEISDQPDEGKQAGGKPDDTDVKTITGLPAVIKPAQDFQYAEESISPAREVRFIPEKIKPVQHPSPAVFQGEHIQPDRFYRQQPSG